MKRLTIILFLMLFALGLSGQGIIRANAFHVNPVMCDTLFVLSGTAKGTDVANNTAHGITLPTGIVPGDLLVVFFATDGAETITISTPYSGNGWSIESQVINGTACTGAVAWKIAEGGDVLGLLTGTSEMASHISYRLSCSHLSNPLTLTSVTGISTNVDPPANTGEYGAQDYLWFAFAAIDDVVVATAAPADFTNLETQAGSFADASASCSVAYRTYNTAGAYDPGAFTSTTQEWIGFTVIINPR